MTSYFVAPDSKSTKKNVGTKSEATEVTRSDQASQTIETSFIQNVDVGTQTIESSVNEQVVVEIPEKLLETIPSKQTPKIWSPPTELSVIKVDDKMIFNFTGAFFNYDGMDSEEILKVHKMLNKTSFEVCERAVNARRVKSTKSIFTA